MTKMSPEQRQWFSKNQSTVFAKLQQHHHRLLLERDKNEQSPEQHLKPLTPVQLKVSALLISYVLNVIIILDPML